MQLSSEMNALQDGLKVHPALPDGLPSRRSITVAVEIATEAGNGAPQAAGTHRLGSLLAESSNHLDDFPVDHLGGSRLGGLLRDRSQPEQAQRQRREDAQQPPERRHGPQRTRFDAAARFE